MTGPARKMDHAFVEKHEVLARYRTNRLDAADADAFEIHYLDCAICRSGLEADNALSDGFKAQASEVLSGTSASPRPAARPWLAPYAVAATVLLAVAAGLLTSQALNREELSATRIVPVLTQRQDTGAGVIDIGISDSPELIVLVIDATQPDLRRYDVSIVNRNDEVVWSAHDVPTRFTLNAERLVVSVPSRHLEAGAYRLRVAGRRDDGQAAGAAEFQLRVNKEP